METYGYARVSTLGQSLKDQIQQLKNVDVKNKNLFHEKYTGTKTDRPQFNKLLSILKPYDTLVVVKLDRLARNTREALNVIHDLREKNINIKVLQPAMTINNEYGGKLMYYTLLMVADFERDMIVERTQEGKRFAKQHDPNFKDGRPKRSVQSTIRGVTYEHIHEYFQNHSATETRKALGISRASVFNVEKTFKQYNKEHHTR